MHAFYCRLLHLHHTQDQDHDQDRQARPVHDDTAGDNPARRTVTQPDAESTSRQRSTRPATPPRLRSRVSADRDRRPSLHTLVVPRLIDSGYSLDQISDLTGMPRALVELIADEHGPADPATLAAAAAARDRRQSQRHEAALARRHRSRAVTIIVLAAVLNIAGGVAAMLWRIPTLGAAATLSAFLLVVAVHLLARRGIRNRPDRSRPPR